MNKIFIGQQSLLSRIVVGWWLIALAGCGGGSVPSAADPEAAKQTLERALSSWKSGEPTEALKKASPPILVSDMSWDRGDKLAKFEIAGSNEPWGAQRKFRVTLWLVDAKGRQKKDMAEYEVGTTPVQTVFRPGFE